MSKIGFILLILTMPALLLSQNVGSQEAKNVAQAKILNDNKSDYKIINTKTIEDGQIKLGYVFELHPKGYIVTSANHNLPPVIAYSYKNNTDNEVRFYSFLKTDLNYRNAIVKFIPKALLNKRYKQWNKLLNNHFTKDSTFQQWPDTGTTLTGGWLESNWTQSAPYNNSRVGKGISAQASHRTVRETLASYGSCHF